MGIFGRYPKFIVLGVLGAICFLLVAAILRAEDKADVVVLISADAEWKAVNGFFAGLKPGGTPFGEFFEKGINTRSRTISTVYVHGGWGKISAAASAQYAIDRWKPALLVNIGTCGGFEGRIERDDVVLVRKTVVYDIIEQMGDPNSAIAFYSADIDLSWLKKPFPFPVKESVLVSADRDIVVKDIPQLEKKYGAVAADWESGAIAFAATKNKIPCLILRAVSDLVNGKGGEAYGNYDLFVKRTEQIMRNLMEKLPDWIEAADAVFKTGEK